MEADASVLDADVSALDTGSPDLPPAREIVLTDLTKDTWVESLRLTQDDLPAAYPSGWSVQKRVLHGGQRDGVDFIEMDNGALSFAVVPTRGMGIWRGWYKGLQLGWQSPVHGPVHPRHVNLLDRGGLGWLDGFDEWICRCGLNSNGPPGEDSLTKEFLTLHGRIANTPAHFVSLRINPAPPFELQIVGQVDEAALFGPNLRLITTITTTPGSNQLRINDRIENRGSRPAEFELLYHCNFGPPFLEPGARLRTPIRGVAPRNERAAEGVAQLGTFPPPTPGYTEQVYYYELLADPEGQTIALLHNAAATCGVALRTVKAELPCFINWKYTAGMDEGYVAGLEPATNFPNFKPFERQRGRVKVLPPRGSYNTSLVVEVFDDPVAVNAIVREIELIQAGARPVIHRTPQAG